MNIFHEDQEAWLGQVREEILEPERPIIDPHHHLWPDVMGHVYHIDDYHADSGTGHNVIGSVFMECNACYREAGPEHEKSLGETEYVLAQAAKGMEHNPGSPLLGMVGYVDLRETETLENPSQRVLCFDLDLEVSGFHEFAIPSIAPGERVEVENPAAALSNCPLPYFAVWGAVGS